MKILKRIAAVIAVLGLTFVMLSAANYCLVADSGAFSRLMMHEFYEQQDVDLLFVGASQYAYGIDPAIISERTGKTAFDAVSVGQSIDVSLALIKEALDRYTPEHIYLDLSYRLAIRTGPYRERAGSFLNGLYVVSDYMHWSRNKLELLLHGTSSEQYIKSFFLPHNVMGQMFSPAAILSNLRRKSTAAYKSYAYDDAVSEEMRYAGNGYYIITPKEDVQFKSEESFAGCTPEVISEDWKNSLRDIIAACQAKDVALTILNMPVSDYGHLAWYNYDRYIEYLRELTAGTEANVVDLNTLDPSWWPNEPSNYLDFNHVNRRGAIVVSGLLADYINGELPEQALLPSVEARMRALPGGVYGLSYRRGADGETITFRIAANRPEQFEYHIEFRTAKGEEISLPGFSEQTEITGPISPRSDVTVSWKPLGAPDTEAKTENFSVYLDL